MSTTKAVAVGVVAVVAIAVWLGLAFGAPGGGEAADCPHHHTQVETVIVSHDYDRLMGRVSDATSALRGFRDACGYDWTLDAINEGRIADEGARADARRILAELPPSTR